MNIRNCTISPSALEDLLLHPYCGLWKVPDVEVALRQGPLFFSGREASDRPLIVPHAFSAIGDNDLVGPKMPGIAADSWQKKTAGLKFCPQNRTRFHPQPSADNPFLSSSYVWNSERLKGVQRFSLPSRLRRGGGDIFATCHHSHPKTTPCHQPSRHLLHLFRWDASVIKTLTRQEHAVFVIYYLLHLAVITKRSRATPLEWINHDNYE